jgi:hypothetical protein
MLQQSMDACEQRERICESLDKAVAEVDRLRSDYENAKRFGAGNAGELQIALTKARVDGRAIQHALAKHVQEHRCKRT